MIYQKSDQNGFVLPMLLSFIIAISIVISAVSLLLSSNFQAANSSNQSQKAFNVAEAGVNYYMWHLNHNGGDFKDGKTTPVTPDPNLGYGPYKHDYIDDNAKKVGTYTLWIKPQGAGSTIATVRSTGTIDGSKFTRTVEAQIGAPSFASYSVAADGALWFGDTESANGPVHSNQGVRMDGASSDNVTSAKLKYVAPGNLGGNGATLLYDGVWCSNAITTPVNCSTRSKVDWVFPAPVLDFNQVSSSLCTLKKTAFASVASTAALATQANACNNVSVARTAAYLPQRAASFSSVKGYMIELLPSGKYNVYNVNDEDDSKASYTAALSLATVATNVTIPADGVIFVEDNVWIRTAPTFSGRVTIGSGRLASSYTTDVNIADDVIYGTKSGADALGLVAEGGVTIMPYAPPQSGSFNFEVDAAVIAQSGEVVFRNKYVDNNSCTKGWKDSNQTFLYYGSISTRQLWTWTYLRGSSSCGSAVYDSPNGYLSGIKNNITQYDYNLLYAPPPSFPLTSGFNILQWHEVVTRP